MTIPIVKFARTPFYVDAVQVTAENMAEVAAWCGGKILADKQAKSFIKVHVLKAITESQTTAYVGDWVLKSVGDNILKVYTAKAFAKAFVPAEPVNMTLTEIFAEIDTEAA